MDLFFFELKLSFFPFQTVSLLVSEKLYKKILINCYIYLFYHIEVLFRVLNIFKVQTAPKAKFSFVILRIFDLRNVFLKRFLCFTYFLIFVNVMDESFYHKINSIAFKGKGHIYSMPYDGINVWPVCFELKLFLS